MDIFASVISQMWPHLLAAT